ncbi:MAG: NAD(P)-binding domain-containing protein, partial [Acidimicrobiia bacterium]
MGSPSPIHFSGRAAPPTPPCVRDAARTAARVSLSGMNVGLLGGGRMGEALALGLVAAGFDPTEIAIA